MNLRTALGLNFAMSGKLLAHWMPWTGNPSRVSHVTGYRQTDPGVADQQSDCMLASGIDGAVLWWQGPSKWTNTAFEQMMVACARRGMPVLVGLDQWIAKLQPNPTQVVIDALKSPVFQFATSFMAEPLILEFDLAKLALVNVAAVQAALPSLQILSKHTGYSWPETDNTFPALIADNARPTMKVPCVFSRFDDGGYPLPGGVGDPAHYSGQRDWNKSVWGGGPTRIIEARGGRTYIESCAAVPSTSKYAALVSWNDYDEGTEHEPECVRATGIKIGV